VLGASGTKRAALNTVAGFETLGTRPNDTIVTEFTSPGNLVLEGLPSTFLEGQVARGDSGGGLFLNSPSGWAVAGVTSHTSRIDNTPEGNAKYRERPSSGGAKSHFVRLAMYSDWIALNLFDAPTAPYVDPTPTGPGILELETASPVSLSTYAVLPAMGGLFSFSYAFLQNVGFLTVLLGGEVLGTIDASLSLSGQFSVPLTADA
jgi:hypothetical protein